jgi:hypothetical protein
MSDEAVKKSDWAVPFIARLSVIGWVCSIFYETLNFLAPIRPVFLLVGFWASVMAFLYAIGLLFIRRNGIFFIFLLVALPPTIHFGLVVKNIAVQKEWIDPSIFGGTTKTELNPPEASPDANSPSETTTAEKPTTE